MSDAFPITSLIDVVIGLTLLEGLALAFYHRGTGRGIAPRDLIPNLGAGLALMGAVRAGLSDAGWGWMAGALLLAGLMHAADLRARWRRAP